MSLITRGSVLSALRPGVHAWWGLGYKRYDDEYDKIYETLRSEMNYELDVNVYGFGVGAVKPEGTPVQFDTMAQGYHYNYVHVPYGLGFQITHEAMQDNLYMKLAEQNTKELGRAMKEAKETVAASLLNLAFSSSPTFADGLSLCNSANLLSGGGTFSNVPSTAADLSELALEQALIGIGGYTDDRLKKTKIMARRLIVPKELDFEAGRILKSELRVGTANNDINMLKSGNYIPEGHYLNHYLTSPSAWFIITDCPQGMQHFVREDIRIDTDNDFQTDNILIKAYERYSFGCTDKHGIYGSNGP
jgi:hypothetical protein